MVIARLTGADSSSRADLNLLTSHTLGSEGLRAGAKGSSSTAILNSGGEGDLTHQAKLLINGGKLIPF
eukprot:6189727-Pleurochrysis_carterae.AAC.2